MRKLKNSKINGILIGIFMGTNCLAGATSGEILTTQQNNRNFGKMQQREKGTLTECEKVAFQAAQAMESVCFGQAEAAASDDNKIDTLEAGGSQTLDGIKGEITTMNGGIQTIKNGGTGTVATMNGGTQKVDKNGLGTINTMNGGLQEEQGGGVLSITTMNGGTQKMNSGGDGIIYFMKGGEQQVGKDATGKIIMAEGSGKQIVNNGGSGMIRTMNGATQIINQGGEGSILTMNAGTQEIYGSGSITSLNGGTQVVEEGGTSVDTNIQGGTLKLAGAGANVKNLKMSSGKIMLGKAGDNYSLDDLDMTGGTIDMTEAGKETPAVGRSGLAGRSGIAIGDGSKQYETLHIQNLEGSEGNFKLNTDLDSEIYGDKVTISQAAGNTVEYIQVNDKSILDGTKVLGNKKLLVATDDSGNITFKGKELDTGGLWDSIPTLEQEGKYWYLTQVGQTVSPETQGKIQSFASDYGVWRTGLTDDTLRKRMGDLRYNNKAKGGLWARMKAGKLAAENYDTSYQTYQLGYDTRKGNTFYGAAVDYYKHESNVEMATGSGNNVGLTLYSTNYHPSGAYGDITLRVGKFRNELKTAGDFPDCFSYGAWGYSAGYEFGKTFRKSNGFYYGPQVQLIYGHLQGGNYTTDRGVNIEKGGINTLLGRIGFVMGKKLNNTSDYYFKANIYREFAGSSNMDFSYGKQTLSEEENNKDTWFELGIGTNIKLNKKTSIYADVSRTFGADIQKRWQANAGVRWAF